MRPHRNPFSIGDNEFGVRANQAYLNLQFRNPPPADDTVYSADVNLDGWRGWVGPDDRLLTDDEAVEAHRLEANPPVPPADLGDGRVHIRLERPRPNNTKHLKAFPALNLDSLVAGPAIPRDIKLPPFKVDYDSHEQINQKLANTVVMIKELPFLVRETIDLGKGKFALLVSDRAEAMYIVNYDDVKDCRGIAPGYFMYRGRAHWVYRAPERQNSQGMGQRNTYYKIAGGKHSSAATTGFLIQSLGVAQDINYGMNLHDVLLGGSNESLRLSNRVALYQTNKKGAPIGVEYCGRPLGLIVNGYVKVLDENDLQPSWIHKDLQKINLQMGA